MSNTKSASSKHLQRLAEVLELSPTEHTNISHLVFYAPSPLESDVMLIFGAPEGDWEVAADAFKAGLAPLIVASGSVHERTKGVAEAILIKRELTRLGVPEDEIITDDTSTNTLENVLHFKKILDQRNIKPKSIIYLTIRHHAGRCFLTLKKYFPEAEITAITHGLLYSGLNFTKDNWLTVEGADARVYGEYQRIMAYADKGDIAGPALITDSLL